MSQDEELAEAWLAQEKAGGAPAEPRVRMSEWSPEREALANLVDLVNALIGVEIAVGGGKPGKREPTLRPVTAIQRLRERDALLNVDSMAARMLGGR